MLRTRTFPHTGPGRGEAFAESSFARQIVEVEAGRRPPVLSVGNLDAVRDFTDVRDVVRAYWALLDRGAPGEVYNVCSGRGVRRGRRPAAGCSRWPGWRWRSARIRAASAPPTSRCWWAIPAGCARPRAGSRASASTARCPTCSTTGARACAAAEPGAVKVLLTGGTGFLGKNVARALAARGHELRLLAREGSNLAGLPAGEIVRGDVSDAATVRRAAEGCQAIVHMAALVKMWVPERAEFARVNVEGLRDALAAAEAVGARLVYTSSFIAIGPDGAQPADESQVHPGHSFRNDYERTKAQADVLARAAAAAGARRGPALPRRRLRAGRPHRRQHRREHDRRPPARRLPGRDRARRPPLVLRLRGRRGRRATSARSSAAGPASATCWPAKTSP